MVVPPCICSTPFPDLQLIHQRISPCTRPRKHVTGAPFLRQLPSIMLLIQFYPSVLLLLVKSKFLPRVKGSTFSTFFHVFHSRFKHEKRSRILHRCNTVSHRRRKMLYSYPLNFERMLRSLEKDARTDNLPLRLFCYSVQLYKAAKKIPRLSSVISSNCATGNGLTPCPSSIVKPGRRQS